MLNIQVNIYPGAVGAEFLVHPTRELEEGVSLNFLLTSCGNLSESSAVQSIGKAIVDSRITWIDSENAEWILDLDVLRELLLDYSIPNWIKGGAVVRPEFKSLEWTGLSNTRSTQGLVSCRVTLKSKSLFRQASGFLRRCSVIPLNVSRLILGIIYELQGSSASFVNDTEIAQKAGFDIQDVRDYLDVLEEESLIRTLRHQAGFSAILKAKGRLALKESEPVNMEQAQLPRRVFISHGHSHDWRQVQNYLEKIVKIDTLELEQEISQGKTILQKLDKESRKCGYAVVVMTGDDSVGKTQVQVRARENVIHEIGFFQGRYGLDRVFVLHEEGVVAVHGLAWQR